MRLDCVYQVHTQLWQITKTSFNSLMIFMANDSYLVSKWFSAAFFLSFLFFSLPFYWYNIISFAIFFSSSSFSIICAVFLSMYVLHFGHTISQLSLPSIIFYYTHSMNFIRTIWTLSKTKQNKTCAMFSLSHCVCKYLFLWVGWYCVRYLRRSPCDLHPITHCYSSYCTVIFFFVCTVWLWVNLNCEWASECAQVYISYSKLKNTQLCKPVHQCVAPSSSSSHGFQWYVRLENKHSALCTHTHSISRSLCTVLFLCKNTCMKYAVNSTDWECVFCALCLFLSLSLIPYSVAYNTHGVYSYIQLYIHSIFKVALLGLPLYFVFGRWLYGACERCIVAVAAAVSVFCYCCCRWLAMLGSAVLCLWYAKCDIFSHLQALRLYECVGVVSHIHITHFKCYWDLLCLLVFKVSFKISVFQSNHISS